MQSLALIDLKREFSVIASKHEKRQVTFTNLLDADHEPRSLASYDLAINDEKLRTGDILDDVGEESLAEIKLSIRKCCANRL